MPGINTVVVAPSKELRDALIRAIEAATGLKPAEESVSVSAQRAHYAPAEAKVIINTASPLMHHFLGKHRVCLAIEVDDRVKAAEAAARSFKRDGLEAVINRNAQSEFPMDFLTFVVVKELDGILLMFWPTQKVVDELSQKDRDMMPKRVPWKLDE